ncbi:MAG: ribosome maturation factor RimP [Holosporales bacterium]|jgi:ribosome maturation factor RimP|nr:ribosome maturation factor RimP [Holosporales bacterium]
MPVLAEKIESDLAPLVMELGCLIVRVMLSSSDRSRTLQIMIEKLDGSAASIGDCEVVSKAISVSLDVLDLIKSNYILEVSSAGIDRPLVKSADFVRFCGKPVVVKTYSSKFDRKIFKGNLELAGEDGIRIVMDVPLANGENGVDLLYSEISSAHVDGFKL